MNLANDPKREERIEMFSAHIRLVFAKCVEHYGLSKYQDSFPSLILEVDEEDIMGGYYCHDLNEMTINYQGFDNSQECYEYYFKLVTHEFIHYLQSPVWFKRYYKYHGHDYLTHPYEIEAYSRENELLELNK